VTMTVSFFTGVGAWVDAVAAAVTDGTAAQAVTLDARAARARADADAAAAAAAAASQAASALASARAATAGRSAAAAGAALDGALEKFGMVGDTLRVVVGTFGGGGGGGDERDAPTGGVATDHALLRRRHDAGHSWGRLVRTHTDAAAVEHRWGLLWVIAARSHNTFCGCGRLACMSHSCVRLASPPSVPRPRARRPKYTRARVSIDSPVCHRALCRPRRWWGRVGQRRAPWRCGCGAHPPSSGRHRRRRRKPPTRQGSGGGCRRRGRDRPRPSRRRPAAGKLRAEAGRAWARLVHLPPSATVGAAGGQAGRGGSMTGGSGVAVARKWAQRWRGEWEYRKADLVRRCVRAQ